MVRKLIPIVFSLLLLSITIHLPSFLSAQKDMELMTYDEKTIETKRIEYKTNKDLSLLERIDFLSLYASTNENHLIALDDSEDMFNVELSYDKVELLYNQLKELYNINGIVDINIDDLEKYYNCNLNTYTNNNIIISVYNLTSLLEDTNIIVDIWFDSETFDIYQYSIIDGSNTKQLKYLNIEESMMKYLNIDHNQFKKYYEVHQDDINVRVELLKTIQ